jgi:trk system potassium uptake protein TrkA
MPLEVMERKTQFAIIGLGLFGTNVATRLLNQGAEVIVVDKDPELVEKMKEYTVHAYVLDSSDENALREAGVHQVDCAVVCIGIDMVGSILTTLLLKQFKIPRIVARANTKEHFKILQLMGVSDIIEPEIETANKLARRLYGQHGFMLNMEQMWKDHAIVEIKVTSSIANKTLAELEIRKNYRVNVVAVKHQIERLDDNYKNIIDFEFDEVPDPNDPLKEDDILIIIGKLESINELNAVLMGKNKK